MLLGGKMLQKNEYVVYKKDICVISEIKEINGSMYYILKPIDDDSLTISLPIESNGFRALLSMDEAMKFIDSIPLIEMVEANNDKSLEMLYKKMLLSLNDEDLIKIIKTTYLRNKYRSDNRKKLGSIDSYYLEEAERRLYLELSIVLHLDIDNVKSLIIDALNK